MKLGKLEKLELRDQWSSESSDFTPWLATEENIELLGDELGIDLEVQSQEESVGPFRADILCVDTTNEHYVLIENQLERTDHTHLGQLITYAAGLDAVSIVWIAAKFTEEHRAALDWLNRRTDEDINFFGVEIELYKIGDSVAAPKFSLVSKPNDWSKSVKQSASSARITDTKLLQQEFWAGLKAYLNSSGSKIKSQKPAPQHWTNFAIGRSYFYLSAWVNTRDHFIAVALVIQGPQCKENYRKLEELYKDESLTSISTQLEWREMEGQKSSQIELKKSKQDISNKSSWDSQHQWFAETLEAFTNYFKPKIKKL